MSRIFLNEPVTGERVMEVFGLIEHPNWEAAQAAATRIERLCMRRFGGQVDKAWGVLEAVNMVLRKFATRWSVQACWGDTTGPFPDGLILRRMYDTQRLRYDTIVYDVRKDRFYIEHGYTYLVRRRIADVTPSLMTPDSIEPQPRVVEEPATEPLMAIHPSSPRTAASQDDYRVPETNPGQVFWDWLGETGFGTMEKIFPDFENIEEGKWSWPEWGLTIELYDEFMPFDSVETSKGSYWSPPDYKELEAYVGVAEFNFGAKKLRFDGSPEDQKRFVLQSDTANELEKAFEAAFMKKAAPHAISRTIPAALKSHGINLDFKTDGSKVGDDVVVKFHAVEKKSGERHDFQLVLSSEAVVMFQYMFGSRAIPLGELVYKVGGGTKFKPTFRFASWVKEITGRA